MIHLNEKFYSGAYTLENSKFTLGGRVCMSLLNLSLKLNHFNIKISINKDTLTKEEEYNRKLKQELLIQESMKRNHKVLTESFYFMNHF